MKKHNMFGFRVTTALMAALALGASATHGQDAKEIADLDAYNEHLKVEDGLVRARKKGHVWDEPLPANVGNAVKKLRALYPDATFAFDPRVASEPITDLVVRSTDAAMDLSALRTASGGKFDINHKGTETLYTLEPNPSTSSNDRQVGSANLTGYLSAKLERAHVGGDKEAVTGAQTKAAIEERAILRLEEVISRTIHDLDPTIKDLEFQYYADAQVLIFIGSNRALQTAATIIKGLQRFPIPGPSPDPSSNTTNQP